MSVTIGVLTSTNRPTRVGRTVADWFMSQVSGVPGMQFKLLDLAEINLPLLNEPKTPMMGDYQHEHTKEWARTIDRLDGFVWVTAEYNHGYTAVLKNAIDTLFAEWAYKPVAFLGYGGLGAARAIEGLVSVAAEVRMTPITRPSLNITDVWAGLDENGQPKAGHLRGDPVELAKELRWWAETLKPAREARK